MKKLPTQWWDWPSAILFVMLMLVTAARLWATEWTPKLGLIQTSALFGSILGLALGYSSFKRGRVWLLITSYTLVILPWQWLSISTSKESTLQRLASVGGRLGHAISEIAARQPVEDFIFFVALMTLLFWVIALYGGYQLARKENLLAAIIPAGLGMVIVELYDFLEPDRILYLGLYLLLSLILLGRSNLIKNNLAWQARNVATSSETGLDISTGVVVAAGALLIAAWLMPLNGYVVEPIQRTWEEIDRNLESTRQFIKDALSAVENYIPSGVGESYGAELTLGRTAAQGDAVLFSVNAPTGRAQRYYWRARTYDSYNNGKWINSRTADRTYSPSDTVFNLTDAPVDETIIVFILNRPQRTLITVNDPLWVSRDATASLAYTGTSTTDLVTLRATDSLRSGERYETQSALRNPTILAMRAAGANYPDWLSERYLQLPTNFPRKIKTLAEEITAAANTPYDKAAAITDYLRKEITYTLSLKSTDPFGGDPIAWMLFNSKEGFCNYYASAEVLMLRSVGVPARLAVGYAQGEKSASTAYIVRNKDSHAWVEVYFPGIGWVEFEPTAAQPQLTRPSGETVFSVPGGAFQPTPPGSDGGGHEPIEDETTPPVATGFQFNRSMLLWVIIFIIGGAWAGLLIYLNRRQPLSIRIPRALAGVFIRNNLSIPTWLQDWLRWTEQTPTERSFEAINHCLRILGKPQPIHATPSERAEVLSNLLPDAATAIDQLTQQHIGALFSPETTTTDSAWHSALSVYIFTLRRYFRPAR